MIVSFIAFSEQGFNLAQKIAKQFPGDVTRGKNIDLNVWVASRFKTNDALIFVGAVGIAVRLITPFVGSKTTDPAVIVIDEKGQYTIPILSGHLGGANELSCNIAKSINSKCIITTATDINNVFAVDEWARLNNCAIKNPSKIKNVSAKLLEGKYTKIKSDWVIDGKLPKQIVLVDPSDDTCDVRITTKQCSCDALEVIPRIYILGMGCKKGTTKEKIKESFLQFMNENTYEVFSVFKVTSIDLKQKEQGIKDFCSEFGFEFETFSNTQLNAVAGEFSSSEFVFKTTGVDNVCERSAMCCGKKLIIKKHSYNGITFALAEKDFKLSWRL